MVKKNKDPHQPKRPLSAYFTWLGENRQRVKEENKGLAHKLVTAKLGACWNALADEVKKSYKDTAQAAMNVWKLKFEEYKKTPEYADWQVKQAAEGGGKGKNRRKKKAPKDPHAPKRPSTGFFLFVADKRAEVKASLAPEDQNKVTMVTKKCGAMWKACGDEVQSKYKSQAAKLKEKYNEALAAYKLTQDYRDHQVVLREFKQRQQQASRPKAKPKSKHRVVKRVLPSGSESSTSDDESS